MWNAINTVMNWAASLNRQEWLVVLLLAMGLGFLCMRGYGSRSNY
jgi:hypothetical protein